MAFAAPLRTRGAARRNIHPQPNGAACVTAGGSSGDDSRSCWTAATCMAARIIDWQPSGCHLWTCFGTGPAGPEQGT